MEQIQVQADAGGETIAVRYFNKDTWNDKGGLEPFTLQSVMTRFRDYILLEALNTELEIKLKARAIQI